MQNSSIQQFEYEQFGMVRITTIDGEPWFVAKDVCNALGLEQVTRAISSLDDDEVTTSKVTDSIGREQSTNIISEAGLYSLILRSRKPEAKSFKRWVTHEVLPSIRRHGMYATPQTVDEMLADPDTMIRTLKALKAERQKVQALTDDNARMLPKALAYDSFIDTDGTYSITSAARFMAQIDKTITRNRLFGYLRADEIICKSTREPTKKGIQRGYVKQTAAKKANGDAAQPYARLTQKGLDWCISHYCKVPVQMQTV